MPVGTAGTVKAMLTDWVRETGADILLANTYHLMLRPGAERVARLGGLHDFMGWQGPILTDSGGYQVMSLAKLRKISEEGVTFQSHIDGSKHMLSPERATEIQGLLGSDIQMVFDECTPFPAEMDEADASMELSLRWAARSKRAFLDAGNEAHAVFGIVQGSIYPELRRRSAEGLLEIGFDGYCRRGFGGRGGPGSHVGDAGTHGAAFARGAATLSDGCRHAARHPRGGGPRHRHVRLCVADPFGTPRPGFHMGWQTEFAQCPFCRGRDASAPRQQMPGSARLFTAPICHHLFRSNELLGPMLLSWANVHFYQELMRGTRSGHSRGAL